MIDNAKISLILTPAIFVLYTIILVFSDSQAIANFGLAYLLTVLLIGAFGTAWCITIYIKEIRFAS